MRKIFLSSGHGGTDSGAVSGKYIERNLTIELRNLIVNERGISYNSSNIETGMGVPMINLASFNPGDGKYKASGLKYYQGKYPDKKKLKPYDLIMCNTQQTKINF